MARIWDPDDPSTVEAFNRGEAMYFLPDDGAAEEPFTGWPEGWTELGLIDETVSRESFQENGEVPDIEVTVPGGTDTR